MRFICLLAILLCEPSFSSTASGSAIELAANQAVSLPEHELWRPLPALDTPIDFSALQDAYNDSTPIATTQGATGAFGLRIRVRSSVDVKSTWFVTLTANYLDIGRGYWQSDSGRVRALPSFGQRASQSVKMLHEQSMPLNLASQESGVLWLYIKSYKFPTEVITSFTPQASFYQQLFWINSITLLSIAVMMTLALIAVFMFFRTRAWVTLACAGYVGLHGIGWYAASGALGHSVSSFSGNPVYLGMMLFPFAIAAASQFAKLLFNCSPLYPRYALFFNGLSAVCLCVGLLMPLLSFSVVFWASHIIALVWVPTAITTGIKMLGQHDFRAKYYLAGNVLYGASLMFYMIVHVMHIQFAVSAEVLVVAALAMDCFFILLSLSEWLKMQHQEYRRSYVMSRIDPLTKIGNRYAFNEYIDGLGVSPYCLAFIDFDGFKAINDRLGHEEGDRFLILAANRMTTLLGKMGRVFRSGGDEFILVVPFSASKEVPSLLEKLKKIMVDMNQVIKDQGWPEAGLSYGIATSTESGTLSKCLTLADQRMYQNKLSKK
ncbi:diguanylate cyclase domain-containing protein [Bermanella sp. R86510]|uniref:sensor domain-containing diguanylate cyclase n=1 Tax=unclassified Bermanella TaxID=2627862 RepID=UPI0037C52B14